jgi:AcrR family transcriptional regulator
MRITKDPEIRRQEIIDSAKMLFEAQGIGKTSMTEIAERVGVAKGLVYYYFSSKEQLVVEVIDQFISGLDSTLLEIMQQDNLDFYGKLTAILNLYYSAIQSHPTLLAIAPTDPGIFSLIRERLSEIALLHAKDLLQILIRGLGDLYIEGVHAPQIHAILIEQTLGLEKGRLQLG